MNIAPASLSLLQSQVLNSLTSQSTSGGNDSWASIFSMLVSSPSAQQPLANVLSLAPVPAAQALSVGALSPTGRNLSLFDPESAYRMMTLINNDEVLYKAQFSEMHQIQAGVSHMQSAAEKLAGVILSTDNNSIKQQLQGFVTQYNDWVQRFAPDLQQGGLLADTQAAQASRFELEQNINNRFFGIADGVHGLRDLGFAVDPDSHQVALDENRLDMLLASNKQGVVDALQEFSANFAKSASLLNSDGNFIQKQLGNLDRAIHFISSNKTSLQAEFGTGDAAKPAGQVAKALAAYDEMA